MENDARSFGEAENGLVVWGVRSNGGLHGLVTAGASEVQLCSGLIFGHDRGGCFRTLVSHNSSKI